MTNPKDNALAGSDGIDLLSGDGGDDSLDGGAQNDMLFGGSGNDYLDGGAGYDSLYGGSGNDILVYDAEDYVIDGGPGIDFLISGDDNVDLADMLNDSRVSNVEVALKGEAGVTGSLAGVSSLEDYGISLADSDKDGNAEAMTLAAYKDGTGWKEGEASGTYAHFKEGTQDLEMYTTMTQDGDAASAAAITLVLSATGS